MKKNGFTLIELLAVIIILAIIALIATPIILDVIDSAKESAAKSEASMIVSGINNNCAIEAMKVQMGLTATDPCAGESVSFNATKIADYVDLGNTSGATAGLVNGRVSTLSVVSNGYTVTYSAGSYTVSK